MTTLQDLLDVQRKANQQLCLSFNEARQEMITALKVARQEKRKRQVMKRELNGLKEEFAKLKGMVHLMVASLNLQNHRVPTEDIQDVFDSQIMEESSEEEEIPQENVVAIVRTGSPPNPNSGCPEIQPNTTNSGGPNNRYTKV